MRANVNTVIPEKLFQRGNFLTWPYDQKRKLFAEHGITAVINLWCKVDPDLSSTTEGNVYITWHCSPSRVPPHADDMVAVVVALMRGGHRVLIHCEAGRGRSVWFTARVAAEYLGVSRAEACRLVKKAVPGHSMTDYLEADLNKESELL